MIHFHMHQMQVFVQRNFATCLANHIVLYLVSHLNVFGDISLQDLCLTMWTLDVYVIRLEVFVEQLLRCKALDACSALAFELFDVVCFHNVTIQIGER